MPRNTNTSHALANIQLAREISDLRLGESVTVLVSEGVHLRNNESGANFVQGAPTPQTVTPTLLRRLRDGDLTLA